MLAVAKELNIALALGETWITRDGRFAAAFEIDGDLAATPSEKGEVMRKIARVVIRNGVWLRRMPNSLDFESRRQLRSLKAAAKTLPAEDRELLELTVTPQGPVLAALAQGCAELIRPPHPGPLPGGARENQNHFPSPACGRGRGPRSVRIGGG